MKIKLEKGMWGFWINPISFKTARLDPQKDLPSGSVIVFKSSILIEDRNQTIISTEYHVIEEGQLIRKNKNEIKKLLSEAMVQYLLSKKEWAQKTMLRKKKSESKYELIFEPNRYDSFILTITTDMLKEELGGFFSNLKEAPVRVVKKKPSEWFYWVEPETMRFLRKKNIDSLNGIFIKKNQRPEDRRIQTSFWFRKKENEEVKEIDLSQIQPIFREYFIKIVQKTNEWPLNTDIQSTPDQESIIIKYEPSKFDVFEFILRNEDFKPRTVADIINNLKIAEPIFQEEDPWIVEMAKSGRAKCRRCGQKIAKNELRIGEPSYFQEHLSYKWFHIKCLIEDRRQIHNLKGYEELSEKDKKWIKTLLKDDK